MKPPIKYVVQIRETERDVKSERRHEYLSAKDAIKLRRKAERHGFYGIVHRVIDTKQLV